MPYEKTDGQMHPQSLVELVAQVMKLSKFEQILSQLTEAVAVELPMIVDRALFDALTDAADEQLESSCNNSSATVALRLL